MKPLGDQWIEIIDGQEHMVKAVAPIELCKGCCFNCNQGGCCWNGFDNCQMGSKFIIKDLGILNDDSLLQCPFCGDYPTLKEELDENDERIYAVEHDCNIDMTTGWNHDKQACIDAWNRRA